MNYIISAIIPVYNCEKYLNFSVESVISQPNFEKVELILVDDGSTDNTPEICDRYSSEYSNIITIHKKNGGVSSARNLGIERASAERISFIDADDKLEPEFFSKMLSSSDADLICCDFCRYENGMGIFSHKFSKNYYSKDEFNDSIYMIMTDGFSLYQSCNKIFKKKIIIDNNIRFPLGVRLGEDMQFVFTYISHIKDFYFVDEPLYYYNINEESVTSTTIKTYASFCEQYLWQCKFFENLECNIDFFKQRIINNFYDLSLGSICSGGESLGFFSGVKYIRTVISDNLFRFAYQNKDKTSLVYRFDRILDLLIKKNMPLILYLFIRFNKFRSKVIRKR